MPQELALETHDAKDGQQLTEHAAARIRELIQQRRLLPGEKIRQVELARECGVSRSPLREALRTLEAEGVICYEGNRGYSVSRLSQRELRQIYRMRSLLEDDLLADIRRPSEQEISELESINEQISVGLETGRVGDVLAANRRFHFCIFELSDLSVFRREIMRLWQLSEGYRATYLAMPETGVRILEEHSQMIDALREYDVARLIELCSSHRAASEAVVVGILVAP
jgi:DNA-binding GntR family transcriptional regulator